MTIRSVGEMVIAANYAQDLQALAHAYLLLFRHYANGVNDVVVPDKEFAVSVHEVAKGDGLHPKITFALMWISTTSWQVATYYSPDSEMFQEGFGVDNVSGYTARSESEPTQLFITIPVSHLLQSREEQVKYLQKIKADDDYAKSERDRLEKIARLQAEIEKLQPTKAPA